MKFLVWFYKINPDREEHNTEGLFTLERADRTWLKSLWSIAAPLSPKRSTAGCVWISLVTPKLSEINTAQTIQCQIYLLEK